MNSTSVMSSYMKEKSEVWPVKSLVIQYVLYSSLLHYEHSNRCQLNTHSLTCINYKCGNIKVFDNMLHYLLLIITKDR